jgi:hypothetical protein
VVAIKVDPGAPPKPKRAGPTTEQHPKKPTRSKFQSFISGLKKLAMKMFLKYEPATKK